MKTVKTLLLCLFLTLTVASCAMGSAGEGFIGILADGETVSSVRAELEEKENSLLASEGDVFWTPSGTLWHTTYKCSYISRSKTVYHGTLEEAKLDGKSGACSACGGSSTSGDVYEQIEGNDIMPGDVYFTRESSLWHSAPDCDMLDGADKIYHGNRALALALGKDETCERCKKSD